MIYLSRIRELEKLDSREEGRAPKGAEVENLPGIANL